MTDTTLPYQQLLHKQLLSASFPWPCSLFLNFHYTQAQRAWYWLEIHKTKRKQGSLYTNKNSTIGKTAMALLMLIGLLLMSSLTKYSVAQLRPMCISQFALANQACAILPTVESPMDQNNTRTPAIVDNNDDDGDDDNDAEREHRHRQGNENGHRQGHGNGHGHRQRHGSGHGHRQRREHGHGHGHGHREGPRAERDCCHWLDEVDEACVCTAMLRLPPFLIKPKHQYQIKVGDSCERTFKCHGV